FDVLIDENEQEVSDDWEDVRFQVLSACNSGVPIADGVTSCWSDDMIHFYKKSWSERSIADKRLSELRVMKLWENICSRIVQLKSHGNENAKRSALQLVKETNNTTYVKSNKSLFDKYFYFG
ncbi:hypothetical protein Tco_1196800, partial [Tanacetum coccineum]